MSTTVISGLIFVSVVIGFALIVRNRDKNDVNTGKTDPNFLQRSWTFIQFWH